MNITVRFGLFPLVRGAERVGTQRLAAKSFVKLDQKGVCITDSVTLRLSPCPAYLPLALQFIRNRRLLGELFLHLTLSSL